MPFCSVFKELTAYVCAYVGTVSLPFITPGLILTLDGIQGKTCPCFDLAACYSSRGRLPKMAFVTCKARNPRTFPIQKEVTSTLYASTRELVREQGRKLGFQPIFVYLSTGNQMGLDAALSELAASGELDILVLAGKDLPLFLPMLHMTSRLGLGQLP